MPGSSQTKDNQVLALSSLSCVDLVEALVLDQLTLCANFELAHLSSHPEIISQTSEMLFRS